MTDQLREALKWLDHQPHAEALTAARELRKWLAVKESPTGLGQLVLEQSCEHGSVLEHHGTSPEDGPGIWMWPCPLLGFSNECADPRHCPGGSRHVVAVSDD